MRPTRPLLRPPTPATTQAVLLAAGVGRRLRPLTDERPKCLVPVGGVPLIDRLISQLSALGVRRFVIATGFRAGQLHRHLTARWGGVGLELRFVHNPDHATTNNLVSLARCIAAIDADPLVVETDLVLGSEPLAHLLAHDTAALISPYTDEMDGTSVAFDPARGVTRMYVGREGAPQRGGFKTVNLTRFAHADWVTSLVPRLEECHARGERDRYYEHVIAGALAAGDLALDGVVIGPDAWAEVDTVEDLRRANALMAARTRTA